jgi:hypothetical protein
MQTFDRLWLVGKATPKVLLFHIDPPWFNPHCLLDRATADYDINVITEAI